MFELTEHAEYVMHDRGIRLEWVQYAYERPLLVEEDPEDASLSHFYARIGDFGNRVLHVVFNVYSDPPKVVTAYFDRGKKL